MGSNLVVLLAAALAVGSLFVPAPPTKAGRLVFGRKTWAPGDVGWTGAMIGLSVVFYGLGNLMGNAELGVFFGATRLIADFMFLRLLGLYLLSGRNRAAPAAPPSPAAPVGETTFPPASRAGASLAALFNWLAIAGWLPVMLMAAFSLDAPGSENDWARTHLIHWAILIGPCGLLGLLVRPLRYTGLVAWGAVIVLTVLALG